MIYVSKYPNGFISEGHGSKEVCAAVSVLTQAVANGMMKHTDVKIEADADRGYFSCFTQHVNREAEVLLEVLFMTLSQIEEHYPDDLKSV